ncbi:hypothetical protein BZA05DRAFT_410668 [Tricharina praecox]|uniref:uncharacterized protein n=1 Tax=Tricharina praecox TaxID=43433 RepID=UPI00221EB087|nr:uncharacterized protein BZA05DRAFT_410668 [Tricharina praecox]KAI5843578.1 hypothetical protein BZA05DRAFT_410668 [Tricharina praecox]
MSHYSDFRFQISSHREVVKGIWETPPFPYVDPQLLYRTPIPNELQQNSPAYSAAIPQQWTAQLLPSGESRLPENVPGPPSSSDRMNAVQPLAHTNGLDLPDEPCMDRRMESPKLEDLEDYAQEPQDMPVVPNSPSSKALLKPSAMRPTGSKDSSLSATAKWNSRRGAVVGTTVPLAERKRNGTEAARDPLAPVKNKVMKKKHTPRQDSPVPKKTKAPYIFHCPWPKCGKSYNRPGNMFRHEESSHIELTRWICALNGPTDQMTGECVYCPYRHDEPLLDTADVADSPTLAQDSSSDQDAKEKDIHKPTWDCQFEEETSQPAWRDGCARPTPLLDHVRRLDSTPDEASGRLSSVPVMPKDGDSQVQGLPGVQDKPYGACPTFTTQPTAHTLATTSSNRMYTHTHPGILTPSGRSRITCSEKDESLVDASPSHGMEKPKKPRKPCGRGCADKPEEVRSFGRKDNFQQHINHCHPYVKWDPADKSWTRDVPPPAKSRCGFCKSVFTDWAERKRHLAEEFVNRRKIEEWEGNGLGFEENEEEKGGNLSNGLESQCLPFNDSATGITRQ